MEGDKSSRPFLIQRFIIPLTGTGVLFRIPITINRGKENKRPNRSLKRKPNSKIPERRERERERERVAAVQYSKKKAFDCEIDLGFHAPEMEKEGQNQRSMGAPEVDFFLQWGNRKRLRCVKVREAGSPYKSDGEIKRKTTSRIDRRVVRSEKDAPFLPPTRPIRNGESATLRKSQSSSPEKEDRYYTTRGSGLEESRGRASATEGLDEKAFVWPKFFISLSSKEKEEDFMAMKGCKLPQRPKKRAKYIQRSIHLVCPGTWLSDLSLERYEVREKKNSKKRARGLKAMKSMESDSD